MMIRLFKDRGIAREGIMKTTFTCVRDDMTISGTEYRKEGDKLPIAIVSHGFMANQNTVRQYTRALAGIGFAAFCFDFNGGSLFGGKSDKNTRAMSVLTEVKDLEAVIEYVKTLPYVDPERIILMGCSQGGFVSALTAVKHKEEIEKLVLFYPALCIPDDARAGKMMFAKFDPKNVPEKINCGPMKLGRQYVTDVLELDPYTDIQDYPGKVLIVHGTNDAIVALDYAKKANEAYRAATPEGVNPDERVFFTIIEDGKHGFSKKHDEIAIDVLKKFVQA